MSKNSIEIARQLVQTFDSEMGEAAFKVGLEKAVANILPMYDRLVNSIAREIDEAYREGGQYALASQVRQEVNPTVHQNVNPVESAPSFGRFGAGAPTKRPPKEELEAALKEEPSKAALSRRYGVNMSTIYNWLDKYGLRERVTIDVKDEPDMER